MSYDEHDGEWDGGDTLTRLEALRLAALAGVGFAVAGSLPTASAWASSGQQSAASAPPSSPTGVLKIANIGEPTTLDITRTAGEQEHAILWHQIYESLVDFRPGTSQLVGSLAKGFTSSSDAREWRFNLKSGIKFHDGEPFTSSAVKSTFAYYAASPSYLNALVPKGLKIDDSDPMVVRFTSPKPVPDLARFMASLFIISPKLTAAGADAVNKTPTGTGPFKFVSYTPSVKVIEEANLDYRGPGPYFEQLEFSLIGDGDARLAALRSGAVDLTKNINPAAVAGLRKDKRFVVSETNAWAVHFLGIFTKTPPMDNVKVRQALAYSIDREAIVKTILHGTATVSDSWSAPGVYGRRQPKFRYPHDPERAKRLLAESGLRQVKFDILYVPEYGAAMQQRAEAIAGMASKVGMKARAVAVPAAKYNARATSGSVVKPWHAVPGGFGNPTGTIGFFTVLGLTPLYSQFTGDPVFNKLVKQVDSTKNGPKRIAICQQIENRVAQLLPQIPLYSPHMIDAYSSKLQGYKVSSFGSDPKLGLTYF
jgi:peptide/nickel transport system substrate-binding protein